MNKLKIDKIKLLDLSMSEQNKLIGGQNVNNETLPIEDDWDPNDPEKITWLTISTTIMFNTIQCYPKNSDNPGRDSCGQCV